MVAEDDIDTESLQAQIDVSMSFAHDLVTSWIKPSHLAQLGFGGSDVTQMLEEELRRPPRLGVGASIPAASSLAQEASKLKRRLGKNGVKNEGAMDSQLRGYSKSDDEEYKGKPAKRKTISDPFGQESRQKKRKAGPTASSCPSVENVPKHPVSLHENSALGGLAKRSQGHPESPLMQHSDWTLPDSCSRKERQQIGQDSQQSHVTEGQRSPILMVSSPPVRLPVQTTFSPSLTASTVPSHSEPCRETFAPVPGKPTNPECSQICTSSMTIPDKAKPHETPLLNLDGPPGPTDKPGNSMKSNSSKRRRKRRKKKNRTIAGTGNK